MRRRVFVGALVIVGCILASGTFSKTSPVGVCGGGSPVSLCDGVAICPEHDNARATFTGKTKQVWDSKKARYCTYGEYSHTAYKDARDYRTRYTCKFWSLCGCD